MLVKGEQYSISNRVYTLGPSCSKGGYSAIHWINSSPADNAIVSRNTYPLESDVQRLNNRD